MQVYYTNTSIHLYYTTHLIPNYTRLLHTLEANDCILISILISLNRMDEGQAFTQE